MESRKLDKAFDGALSVIVEVDIIFIIIDTTIISVKFSKSESFLKIYKI
jgi:hypothetical protein